MSDIPFLQILEDNKLRAVCLKIKQTLKMKSAEVKVLTILSYYFILAVIVLTNTTIRVIDMPQFFADLVANFTCESIPDGFCERAFENLGAEIITMINYLLFGMYPIVNLLYVINIRELKMKYLKWQVQIGRRKTTPRTAGPKTYSTPDQTAISRSQSQSQII